uniref:Uncharacterized protein n=1 Tax=Setaria digitata TaxID=48799 RepID=A0A915PMZ8_9BILA
MNNAEYLVDTRGSGFSLKTASIVALLFGSIHLSLVRSSDEDQKFDAGAEDNERSSLTRTKKPFEVRKRSSEVQEDYKESYVAHVLKTVMERSLLSLIRNATAKVKVACGGDRLSSYYLHGPDYTSNHKEVVNEQKEGKNVALDDLVKNADARKEINKIFNVVSIGREETEIRDHPLLIVAESTAYYLMQQMSHIEA